MAEPVEARDFIFSNTPFGKLRDRKEKNSGAYIRWLSLSKPGIIIFQYTLRQAQGPERRKNSGTKSRWLSLSKPGIFIFQYTLRLAQGPKGEIDQGPISDG
jgi:hypothetical protein